MQQYQASRDFMRLGAHAKAQAFGALLSEHFHRLRER